MDIHFVDNDSDEFPAPSLLKSKDLAVIGSNLKPTTIIKAYKKGYFPWFNAGEPPCWFHMDPRMVLFPKNLRVSKSMRQLFNQNKFTFTTDQDFAGVVRSCRYISRREFSGSSWISDEIEASYGELFKRGIAHSAETWFDSELVGGLYGIQLGSIFFGESMFAKEANASKFAFINFVRQFAKDGGCLIDCQQNTSHLFSLGAAPISRRDFVRYLEKCIPQNDNVWTG